MGKRRKTVAEDPAQFLAALPLAVRPIVRALSGMIRQTVPDAVETMLWGGLSYHRPAVGGRVKGALCLIGVKDGEVRLDFIHGVRLADPLHLLRGTLISKRHVVIDSVAAVRRRGLADLLRSAAAVDFGRPLRRSSPPR
jgi:hypothetical protein